MRTQLWPLDLGVETSGAWELEVYGEPPSGHSMGIPEEKNQINVWGTWDSNPGPNSFSIHLLANSTSAFLCYHNKMKLLYMKTIKTL